LLPPTAKASKIEALKPAKGLFGLLGVILDRHR
jgi:hypothetical protein